MHEASTSRPDTFRFDIARSDDEAVMVAAGEIDLASSPDLRRELHGMLDDGTRTIVLDLTAVTFIDSSGLGVLVGVLKRVNENGDGGRLELRGLSGPVRRVFEITGLHEVFDVVEPPEPA
jgi:anti-anti-sigma factor